MSESAPTFLHAARRATSSLHEELEGVVGLEQITQSREAYREILRTFYGIWQPLELLLRNSDLMADTTLQLADRFRADALHHDLESLGESPLGIQALPQAELPWSVVSRSEAAGILYVMEGSTHGGKVIGKVLQEKLGISLTEGGRFFAGHGERNLELWKGFVQWTESHLQDDEIPGAAGASQRTFETLISWFQSQKVLVTEK